MAVPTTTSFNLDHSSYESKVTLTRIGRAFRLHRPTAESDQDASVGYSLIGTLAEYVIAGKQAVHANGDAMDWRARR